MVFSGVRFLARESGIQEITYENNGKPRCHEFSISISHSGDFAVLMCSATACGIDIEKISDRILKIKDRFLTDSEKIICGEELQNFTICWAVKEALFKKWGQETVFFKTHQLITEINKETKSVAVSFVVMGERKSEILIYDLVFSDYILAYTT